jgi:hypothetical protein
MSAQEKLLDFIHYAGDVFGYEEFEDAELTIEVEREEDPAFPCYSTDLVREETGEVFRFCLIDYPPSLEDALPGYFEAFREFEAECEDEYEGVILLLRPDREDQDDFWYIHRTDTGEVGFFHSDLSNDLEEDDDDEDENDDEAEPGDDIIHTNGHK